MARVTEQRCYDPFIQEVDKLVTNLPPFTRGGAIRYVITSGGAIKLTDADPNRKPTDIDVIPLSNKPISWNEYDTTTEVDFYPLDNCFAGHPLPPKAIEETAQVAKLYPGGPWVPIINSTFLVLQKGCIAYDFDGASFPREKDRRSARKVVTSWRRRGLPPYWTTARDTAIQALPRDMRLDTLSNFANIKRKTR